MQKSLLVTTSKLSIDRITVAYLEVILPINVSLFGSRRYETLRDMKCDMKREALLQQ